MSFKQQKPLSPMNCESYTNIITNWQKVNKTGVLGDSYIEGKDIFAKNCE